MKTIFLKFIACVVVLLSLQSVLFAKTFTDYGRVWYVDVASNATPSDISQEIQNKLNAIKNAMPTTQNSVPVAFTLLFPLRTYQVENVKFTFSFPATDYITLHLIGLTEDLNAVDNAFGSTQGSQALPAQNNFINAHLAKTSMSSTGVPSDNNFLTSSPTAYPTLEMTMAPNDHRSAEFFEIANGVNGSGFFQNTLNMMGLRFTDNTQDYLFYYNSPTDKHPLYAFASTTPFSPIYYTIYVQKPYNIYLDNLIVENMWANGFFIEGQITQYIHQKNNEVIIADNLLKNIWGRNNVNVPASVGIQMIGMKDAVIRRNKIYNDLSVTKQLAGGIGLCGGCENNRDVLMENNEVCGYEYSYWLEGNSGGIELKGNRSIGTENGLTVSRNTNYVNDRPYNVNYIHDNYFSNEGLDPTNLYYSAQYGPQAGRMLWFDDDESATEFVKLRNNTIEIDESNYITYRQYILDVNGTLSNPTLNPNSPRYAMVIDQNNLQFLCNEVTVNGTGTNQTKALITTNKGWLLNNTFDNLDQFDNNCNQKQYGNTFINMPNSVINPGTGPCPDNTTNTACEIDYDNTQILNGIFTLKYSIHEPCNEGAASAFAFSVSGGTPGYHFTMDGINVGYPNTPDGTVTNLTKGLHTFTITDNNNVSASFTFNIDNDVYYICTKTTASQIIQNQNLISFYFTKILLDNDLTVDINNLNFYNCTISIRPGHKIQVDPGSHLYFQNCTLLTGCGQDMWDGIYAEDPTAEITLENCTIQDMENGVVLKQGAKTTITNSEFKNCNRSIAIFENNAITNCSITGNTFTADANMLAPYANLKPEHGIYVENSASLQLGDINNTNVGNTFNNLYNGIYITNTNTTLSSTIELYNNSFSNIEDNTLSSLFPEADKINNCYQSPMGAAIFSHFGGSPLSNGGISLKVSNTLAASPSIAFTSCDKGIVCNQTALEANNLFMDNVLMGMMCGFTDNKVYDIQDNIINNTFLGIQFYGQNDNSIAKNNTISCTLHPNGIQHSNILGATPYWPRGMDVWNFSVFNAGTFDVLTNHITIPHYAGGGIALANTNGFVQAKENDIHLTTSNGGLLPYVCGGATNLYGIGMANSDGTKVNKNDIYGNTSGTGLNEKRDDAYGIFINKSSNHELGCNFIQGPRFGMMAWNKCATNPLSIKGNIVHNSELGWVFRHLGDEGTFGNVGSASDDNNNTFTGSYSLAKVFKFCENIDGFSIYTNTTIFQNESKSFNILYETLDDCPYLVAGNAGSYNVFNSSSCVNLIAPTNGEEISLDEALAIATNTKEYAEYPELMHWYDSRRLYEYLSVHAAFRNSNAVLLNFYTTASNAAIAQEREADIRLRDLIESFSIGNVAYRQARLQQAEETNEEIDNSQLQDYNEQEVNRIYLALIRHGIDSFKASDKEFIADLAVQCPYVAGGAVYKARSLNISMQPALMYDDMKICNSAGVYKQSGNGNQGTTNYESETKFLQNLRFNENTAEKPAESDIAVFPVPATSYVDIEYAVGEDAFFILYNSLGEKVIAEKLDKAINLHRITLNNLSNGVYHYEIQFASKQKSVGKITILN